MPYKLLWSSCDLIGVHSYLQNHQIFFLKYIKPGWFYYCILASARIIVTLMKKGLWVSPCWSARVITEMLSYLHTTSFINYSHQGKCSSIVANAAFCSTSFFYEHRWDPSCSTWESSKGGPKCLGHHTQEAHVQEAPGFEEMQQLCSHPNTCVWVCVCVSL